MSNIQDMNNRIKQNRDQRPSKRNKFKENNRDIINVVEKKSIKPIFKTVSEKELLEIKKRIREHAKKARKKDQAIYLILFTLGLIAIIAMPLLLI